MKRALAALAAFLLTAALSACAEAAPFTFRNGLSWGMSQAAVLEAEGSPEYQTDRENGMPAIVVERELQEDAPCTAVYMFMDDRLAMARFEYDTEDDGVSFEALEEKLCEKYGEATPLDTELLTNQLLDDESAPDRLVGWTQGDDTLIYLMENTEDESVRLVLSDLSEVE